MVAEHLNIQRARHRSLLIWGGWIEAIAVIAVAFALLLPGTGSDPAGSALGEGILIAMVLVLSLFVGPGLLLAHLNRWLGASMLLLLVPAFLMFLLAVAVFG